MTKPSQDDSPVPHDDDAPGMAPRRDFLKASAAAAGATLLSSCVGGGDGTAPFLAGAVDDPLARFDHLVVLMFENRSFDNLLGYLYPPGSAFNGLYTGTYENPVPTSFIKDGHTSVAARPSPGTDADFQNPNPDPGEGYPQINTQLYSIIDPATNQFESSGQMTSPWNAPAPGQVPNLQGFVQDYCSNFVATQGRIPTFDEYRVIMDAFTPAQLPVLSKLAQSFAVYDAWFCAVPSQTYCNRSFFHASTSSGFVLNAPHSNWLLYNTAPTIFNRLQDAGRSWCIYFDATQLVSLTGLIHASVLFPYWKTHFATMDDFYKDVAAGTLPDYAFVEPRMLFNHNDFHPPGPLVVDGVKIPDPSDVRCGDLLLHQVYDAVRVSAAPTGSSASNTMLLVTFDEHGGCYDHVAPGPARTPQILQPAGQMDFFFDRLGLRVPTIAISAYTAPATIIERPIHHGALVRTLCEKFRLPFLTERDRDAPDIRDAINLDSIRDPSTWPVTHPGPVPPGALNTDPLSPELAPLPLDELELAIVALAMARFTGIEPAPDEVPKTVGAAYTLLLPLTAGQFGRS